MAIALLLFTNNYACKILFELDLICKHGHHIMFKYYSHLSTVKRSDVTQ